MTAEEFRAILTKLGITQAEAARRLGFSRVWVNGLATGRISIRPMVAAFIRELFLPRRTRPVKSSVK